MDRETIISFWLNCLLVKEGIRPGCIPDTPETLKNFFKKIATEYFNLNTFSWANNLLITKHELSDATKEKIIQGYEWAKLRDPRQIEYHTILGHTLGYDCVEDFSMIDVKKARVAFSFNVTLINEKKIQLFPYVCPAVYIDGGITYANENLDIALRYLNRIKSTFRENDYSKFIVDRVSLEISYVYPFSSRLITPDELKVKGLPMPPIKKPDEMSPAIPVVSTSELLTVPLALSPNLPAEIAVSSSSGGKRKKTRRAQHHMRMRMRSRKYNFRKPLRI